MTRLQVKQAVQIIVVARLLLDQKLNRPGKRVETLFDIHFQVETGYLRAPRRGPFKRDWRSLCGFRLGLLMMKVPLPWYSAL
jgi:hypothetical protein